MDERMRSLVAVEMEIDSLPTRRTDMARQMDCNCREIAQLKAELFNLKTAFQTLQAQVNFQSPLPQVNGWKESTVIPCAKSESKNNWSEWSQEEIRLNALVRMNSSPSMKMEEEPIRYPSFPQLRLKGPEMLPFSMGVN